MLAKELHYTENVEDSTTIMSGCKQVMIKLAENGGKVLNKVLLTQPENRYRVRVH